MEPKITLNLNPKILNKKEQKEKYEQLSLNLWYEFTRDINSVFFDVGAHTGIYSIIGNLNKNVTNIIAVDGGGTSGTVPSLRFDGGGTVNFNTSGVGHHVHTISGSTGSGGGHDGTVIKLFIKRYVLLVVGCIFCLRCFFFRRKSVKNIFFCGEENERRGEQN